MIGRLCIANLELDGLPFLDDIPNDNGSALLVGSDQITNEKISARELRAVLVHGDTDMESPLSLGTFIRVEMFKDRLQTMQGRNSTELLNDVVLRLGYDKSIADGTATL